jgi:TRAP-type C4-dicarboxylate transport system permease small subunit
MAGMGKLERASGAVFEWMERGSWVLLILTIALAVANILARVLFKTPIFGTFEGVCYMAMIMAVLAMPSVEFTDSNIKVTLITEMIPFKARKVLRLIVNFIITAGCLVVGYRMMGLAAQKIANRETTADLKMPVFIFVYFIMAGFGLIAACSFVRMIINFKKPENQFVINLPRD